MYWNYVNVITNKFLQIEESLGTQHTTHTNTWYMIMLFCLDHKSFYLIIVVQNQNDETIPGKLNLSNLESRYKQI